MPLLLSLIGLTVVVLAALLLPLLHGWRAQAERPQYDRAVYRAQLSELERDVARGLIAGPDVAAARLEIERRLLTATATPAAAPRLGSSRSLAIATALIVAGGAGLAYLQLGAPGVPDVPFASRNEAGMTASNPHAGNNPHGDDTAAAVATLAAKLKANPSDADGWLLLARSAAELGNWDMSADAFAHAQALGRNGPDVLGGRGEMLVLAAGGIVGPPAHALFVQALQGDPKNEVARYYLALGDAQAGESRRAIAAWVALAADIPEDSAMRDAIAHGVTDAASEAGIAAPPLPKGQPASAPATAAGPTGAPVDSTAMENMPPAERDKAIRGMVAQLAARLATTPNDLDGWLQLGRAYTVLGESDKATDAYEHAAKLKPQDLDIQVQEIAALLDNTQPHAPVPPRAVELLQHVAAAEPDRPEVLWYQGIVAVQTHQTSDAKRYWQRLLTLLPADSDEHKMVASALQEINAP